MISLPAGTTSSTAAILGVHLLPRVRAALPAAVIMRTCRIRLFRKGRLNFNLSK